MSIIAVQGFPVSCNLKEAVRALARVIHGHFEAINFVIPKGNKKMKICYLRLSEKLDPVHVVQKINTFQPKGAKKYKAYIPKVVPDIPLAWPPVPRPAHIQATRPSAQKPPKGSRVPKPNSLEQILILTTSEIMLEMISKFPGLCSLHNKSGNKLFKELFKTIYSRACDLAESSAEARENCINLSEAYRRIHPHFGDFQLALTTLHNLQDTERIPRTRVDEADLASSPSVPNNTPIDIPLEKVQEFNVKYTDKIIDQMTKHINSLPSDISEGDTEEDIARKQVRAELKKMAPFFHNIVSQLTTKHFEPNEGPQYRIRIYGEPSLPDKDVLTPFLSRFKPQNIVQSYRMFNLQQCTVPHKHYPGLIAMNGTVLNGAKLTIRALDSVYQLHDILKITGHELPFSNGDIDNIVPELMEI